AQELVRHRFNERAAELSTESAALFNAVLDERYDAPTQKLMRQLLKRQPTAFKKTDNLYIRAQGMRITVGASLIGHYDVARWSPEVAERPILYGKEDAEPSAPLGERIARHALNTEQFSTDVKAAYRRALGALDQFTTAKALTEGWPEALPVIGHLLEVEE